MASNGRRFVLRCGRLVTDGVELLDQYVTVERGQIVAVGESIAADEDAALTLSDAIVAPGFVDVHTHGGGGFNLHTTDGQEIQNYARWAPSTGTTAFLVGTVGVPNRPPRAEVQAAVAAIQSDDVRNGGSPRSAENLGIHLEGPYMNVARRGAHDPSWLRMPDQSEIAQLIEDARGYLRLITVAPELPGAQAMIDRLIAAGTTVSIGHTDATYEQAQEGIGWGITHATHCFNAMRPLLHRDPGALGAIIETPSVRGEIIADGAHVHPAAMRVLIRALGPDRTVVVTDALAAAGDPDATFTFAGQTARVIDGVARLADGTITGSVLTMVQALRNLVTLVDVPLAQAIAMLSINPARSVNVADRKGCIAVGYDADLVILDRDLQLGGTICRGTLAYVADDWRDRLAPLDRLA
jgi:N-acetylglucosamine-6-phosphate deacetylase